jgi:hypothetical protein
MTTLLEFVILCALLKLILWRTYAKELAQARRRLSAAEKARLRVLKVRYCAIVLAIVTPVIVVLALPGGLVEWRLPLVLGCLLLVTLVAVIFALSINGLRYRDPNAAPSVEEKNNTENK